MLWQENIVTLKSETEAWMYVSELRTEEMVFNSEEEVIVKKVELLRAIQGRDKSELSYE